MIRYSLRKKISEYGAVCRDVCQCDEQMLLKKIVERINVEKQGQGARCLDEAGQPIFLTGDEVVSTNFWGFHPSVFGYLERLFRNFLDESGQDTSAEFYIPTAVDTLIHDGSVRVKVLPAKDNWFGVTYRQDMPGARKCIRELIDNGMYPERLWQGNES